MPLIGLSLTVGVGVALPTTVASEIGLVAADDFTYSPGNLDGKNNGIGWTSAWTPWPGLEGTIVVDENRALTHSFVSLYTRRFPPTPDGADVFFSARLRRTGGGDPRWSQMVRLYAAGQNEDVNSASLGFVSDQFLSRAGPSSGQVAFGSFFPAEEHLLVGKVEFDEVGGNQERVTVWVDPIGVETSPISGVSTANYTGLGFVDTVSLRVFELNNVTVTWDDLRIGTTWAAVIPEPSTLVLLCIGVVGLLGYAWRRRRR